MIYEVVPIRYWGRKPIRLAKRFIKRFSNEGEIVLDAFGGSGTFIKAALGLQRRAIYIDLNPFAELIAHSTIGGCSAERLEKAVQKILSRYTLPIKSKNRVKTVPRSKVFSVKCTCGQPIEAKYVVFTKFYRAFHKTEPNVTGLMKEIYFVIARKKKITHEELLKHFMNYNSRIISYSIKWLVKNNLIREEEKPIKVFYNIPCRCGRRFRRLTEDPWVIKSPIIPAYWYPKNKLYYKGKTPFLKKRDASSIDGFFLDRSLALLSGIWKDIQDLKVERDVKYCLQLAFMATLIRSSKMCRLCGGTWPINSYWIPRQYVVRNPYLIFKLATDRILKILKGRQHIVNCGKVDDVIQKKADVSFMLADSTKIKLLKESVDYVIVDPPHTDEVQFFELSLFYTAWLKKNLDFRNEIVINPRQQKDLNYYLYMLKKASEKIHYALKPGRYYTVILHEENQRVLNACMETILTVGFSIVSRNKIGDYTVYTFRKIG
jgi:16S rRNA G966 N2-methylase RsmD